MSDILIAGAAGFVGSNLANYAVQNTKFDITSIDALKDIRAYMNLAPALAARGRHKFYIAKVEDSEIIDRILEIERPKHVIYNCYGSAGSELIDTSNYVKFIDAVMKYGKVETILVLLKDFAFSPEYHSKSMLTTTSYLRKHLPSQVKWHVVSSCELFGPRQQIISWIPKTVDYVSNDTPFSVNESKIEILYIRDYFQALINLIEKKDDYESGIYRIFSGLSASKKDILYFMKHIISGEPSYNWTLNEPKLTRPDGVDLVTVVNYDIYEALEHTASWYSHNKWAWGK